jgi:hypothetical protein
MIWEAITREKMTGGGRTRKTLMSMVLRSFQLLVLRTEAETGNWFFDTH